MIGGQGGLIQLTGTSVHSSFDLQPPLFKKHIGLQYPSPVGEYT